MDLGLKDKHVLITASSGGIGQACAEVFLQEGAKVMLNGRDESHLAYLRDLLAEKYHSQVLALPGDASDEAIIQDMKKNVSERWGTLDVLIPCLGTGKPIADDRLDIREWKYMQEANLAPGVRLISALYPLLKKGANAAIILISSIAAIERISAPYAYAAAKASVLTLAKYLSADAAKDNIRINAVVPGNVYVKGGRWDELLRSDEQGITDYIREAVPMRRFGKPEEIASAVAFLASESSSFTTGASLIVDGGQSRAILC